MPDDAILESMKLALSERFGEEFAIDQALPGLHELAKIAKHRSHRRYLPGPIEPDLLRLLCACALSAPSKSDLQQCDIVIVSDAAIRKAIKYIRGVVDQDQDFEAIDRHKPHARFLAYAPRYLQCHVAIRPHLHLPGWVTSIATSR